MAARRSFRFGENIPPLACTTNIPSLWQKGLNKSGSHGYTEFSTDEKSAWFDEVTDRTTTVWVFFCCNVIAYVTVPVQTYLMPCNRKKVVCQLLFLSFYYCYATPCTALQRRGRISQTHSSNSNLPTASRRRHKKHNVIYILQITTYRRGHRSTTARRRQNVHHLRDRFQAKKRAPTRILDNTARNTCVCILI